MLDSGSRTKTAAPWVAVDRPLTARERVSWDTESPGELRDAQPHSNFRSTVIDFYVEVCSGPSLASCIFMGPVRQPYDHSWSKKPPQGSCGPRSCSREARAAAWGWGPPLPVSALMRCPQGNSEHPTCIEQCQPSSEWVPGVLYCRGLRSSVAFVLYLFNLL